MKELLIIFLILLLSGCAAARKEQNLQAQQSVPQSEYSQQEAQQAYGEPAGNVDSGIYTQQYAAPSTLSEQKMRETDSANLHLSKRQIQTALKNAGFYNGDIDGKIGPKTKEAIRAFQKAKGLKPDGLVGRRTIEKLNNYL